MGHEDTILSQFIGIGLILIGAVSFYKTLMSGKKLNLSSLELFTIHDIEPVQTRHYTMKTNVKKAKPKKKKVKPDITDFQKDCILALKSLGFKNKKEREYIANTIINEHNPKTIQEFIVLASKKIA